MCSILSLLSVSMNSLKLELNFKIVFLFLTCKHQLALLQISVEILFFLFLCPPGICEQGILGAPFKAATEQRNYLNFHIRLHSYMINAHSAFSFLVLPNAQIQAAQIYHWPDSTTGCTVHIRLRQGEGKGTPCSILNFLLWLKDSSLSITEWQQWGCAEHNSPTFKRYDPPHSSHDLRGICLGYPKCNITSMLSRRKSAW